MNVIGWNSIVAQLAVFFAVLKRRPNHGTPFNLFLTGNPGTNKTEGSKDLMKFLGYTVAGIDCAIIDDVSELAGIVDLNANRNLGEKKIIEGSLLQSDILVLDEFLNTRPHVMPQFRRFLQGELLLLADPVPMKTRAIIATGNLTTDMQSGQANDLDSPTADRFALIVHIPSLFEMNRSQQEAILEGMESDGFAVEFTQALQAIDGQYETIEKKYGWHATRFVLALGDALQSTPYAFEGRRAKLLRSFVIAALTLSYNDKRFDMYDVVWNIVRDCLSYHKLSGVELDETVLLAAHQGAIAVLQNLDIEAQIAIEQTISEKIHLVIQHLDEISPITKLDVLVNAVTAGDDNALKIAVKTLAENPRFSTQPPELLKLMRDISLSYPSNVRLTPKELAQFARMSNEEKLAYEICAGDQNEANRLLVFVDTYLKQWGIK